MMSIGYVPDYKKIEEFDPRDIFNFQMSQKFELCGKDQHCIDPYCKFVHSIDMGCSRDDSRCWECKTLPSYRRKINPRCPYWHYGDEESFITVLTRLLFSTRQSMFSFIEERSVKMMILQYTLGSIATDLTTIFRGTTSTFMWAYTQQRVDRLSITPEIMRTFRLYPEVHMIFHTILSTIKYEHQSIFISQLSETQFRLTARLAKIFLIHVYKPD